MKSQGSPHYCASVEDLGDGLWGVVCNCGEDFAPYPFAEDALDALMEHAAEMAREFIEGDGLVT